MNEFQASSAFLSISVVLQVAKVAFLLCIGPQDCHSAHSPEQWSTCEISFPLSPLPGAQVQTQSLYFPSYLIMCVFFLQPLLYMSPASFELVFHESSTCRCIFDVFVGRGEVHILLLHHLDLPSLKSPFFLI